MAIKNVSNQIKVLLVLAVLVFAGATPSYGAVAKGASIEVIMKDDIYFKGELLSISGRTLFLYNDRVKKEFRVDIGEVKTLIVHPKSLPGKQILIGGSLGAIAAITGLTGGDPGIKGASFYALLGGGLWMLGSLSTPTSKTYPIEYMPTAAVNDVLSRLSRSTRENLPWDKAARNGLLGRFRVSWRPFLNHNINMNITANVQVPADPLNSDPQLNARVYLYSRAIEYNRAHLGKIRVDYMLRNHFSLGIEYVSLGSHKIYERATGSTGTLKMTRNQKQYHANFYCYGDNSAHLGLIGLNYDIPENWGNPFHLRIETGIGLSFIEMNLKQEYYPGKIVTVNRSCNRVGLAMQLGLSMDFYPNDPISPGMYAALLYAPASFPGLKENLPLYFYEDGVITTYGPAFRRDGILDFQKGNFSMGGFSLGFFIRIR
ncbi:MAG TPA: hypothetical protein VK469_09240 [Candidatus Kapabacteria bacterium]|nr:hypothetical protein [Candidatus Kapabacteria bacterium]